MKIIIEAGAICNGCMADRIEKIVREVRLGNLCGEFWDSTFSDPQSKGDSDVEYRTYIGGLDCPCHAESAVQS